MEYTVVAGKTYQAKIKLGFFEKLASNDAIASKLIAVGLKDVKVWGSGSERYAQGTSTISATVELPSQIVDVKELG